MATNQAHDEIRALAEYLQEDETEVMGGMNMVLAGSSIMWGILSGQPDLVAAAKRKKNFDTFQRDHKKGNPAIPQPNYDYPEKEQDASLVRRKTHWYILNHRKDRFAELYALAINKALQLNVGLAFNEYVHSDAPRRIFVDIEFEGERCTAFNAFLEQHHMHANQFYQQLRFCLARTLLIPDQEVNDNSIAVDVRVPDRIHLFVLSSEQSAKNKDSLKAIQTDFEKNLYEKFPNLPKTLLPKRNRSIGPNVTTVPEEEPVYKTIVDIGANKSLRPPGAGKVKSPKAFNPRCENYYYKPYLLDHVKENDTSQITNGVGPYEYTARQILQRMLWISHDDTADQIWEGNTRHGGGAGRRALMMMLPSRLNAVKNNAFVDPLEQQQQQQQRSVSPPMIPAEPFKFPPMASSMPNRRRSLPTTTIPRQLPPRYTDEAAGIIPQVINSQPRRHSHSHNRPIASSHHQEGGDNESIRSFQTTSHISHRSHQSSRSRAVSTQRALPLPRAPVTPNHHHRSVSQTPPVSNRGARSSTPQSQRSNSSRRARQQIQEKNKEKETVVRDSIEVKRIKDRLKIRTIHKKLQAEGCIDLDEDLAQAIQVEVDHFTRSGQLQHYYQHYGVGQSPIGAISHYPYSSQDTTGIMDQEHGIRINVLDPQCILGNRIHQRTQRDPSNVPCYITMTRYGCQYKCFKCVGQKFPTRRIPLHCPLLVRYFVNQNLFMNAENIFSKYDYDHGVDSFQLFKKLDIPFLIDSNMLVRIHQALEHQNAQFTVNLLKLLFRCVDNNAKKRLAIVPLEKTGCVFYVYEGNIWKQYTRDSFRHYCRLLLQGLLILYNEIYLIPRNRGIDDHSMTGLCEVGAMGQEINPEETEQAEEDDDENEEETSVTINEGGHEDPFTGRTIKVKPKKRKPFIPLETLYCYRLWDQFTKTEFLNSCLTTLVDELTIVDMHDPLIDKLDTKRRYLAFKNHVYDLETDQIVAPEPDQFISRTLGYEYIDEEAVLSHELFPLAVRFFRNLFPRRDVHDFVWFILSRSLGLDTPEWLIIGPGGGSNGKTMCTNVFMFTWGDYWGPYSSTLLSSARTEVGKPQPELFALNGLRMVTTQEPEADRKFNAASLKNRFDVQVARTMYSGKMEKLHHTFTHWVLTNDVPDTNDNSFGMTRRLTFIEFAMTFCAHPDPKLPLECAYDNMLNSDVLKAMAPVVMALAIKYRKFKDKRLPETLYRCPPDDRIPDYCKKYKEQYTTENNALQVWITEVCKRGSRTSIISLNTVCTNVDLWMKSRYKDQHQEYNASRKIRKILLRTALERFFGIRGKPHGNDWLLPNIIVTPEFEHMTKSQKEIYTHKQHGTNSTTTNATLPPNGNSRPLTDDQKRELALREEEARIREQQEVMANVGMDDEENELRALSWLDELNFHSGRKRMGGGRYDDDDPHARWKQYCQDNDFHQTVRDVCYDKVVGIPRSTIVPTSSLHPSEPPQDSTAPLSTPVQEGEQQDRVDTTDADDLPPVSSLIRSAAAPPQDQDPRAENIMTNQNMPTPRPFTSSVLPSLQPPPPPPRKKTKRKKNKFIDDEVGVSGSEATSGPDDDQDANEYDMEDDFIDDGPSEISERESEDGNGNENDDDGIDRDQQASRQVSEQQHREQASITSPRPTRVILSSSSEDEEDRSDKFDEISNHSQVSDKTSSWHSSMHSEASNKRKRMHHHNHNQEVLSAPSQSEALTTTQIVEFSSVQQIANISPLEVDQQVQAQDSQTSMSLNDVLQENKRPKN